MADWELYDGEKIVGPTDEATVLEAIRAGLQPAVMVRQVGTEEWKSLRSHAPFAASLEQRTASAGTALAAPAPPAPMARRVRKSEFLGTGCVIQGLGFFAPFVGALAGPVGIGLGVVAFLVLLLVGRQYAIGWTCGACGNRLASDRATICSVCRAQLRA